MLLQLLLVTILSADDVNLNNASPPYLTNDGFGIFKIGEKVNETKLKNIKNITVFKDKNNDGLIYRIECHKKTCVNVSINDGIVSTIDVEDQYSTDRKIKCGSSIKEGSPQNSEIKAR